MSGNIPIIQGATKRVRLNLYETNNRAGPARDLSGATVSIIDVPANMPKPSVAILNPEEDGMIRLSWTKEQTARLKLGQRTYWTRVAIDYPTSDREVVTLYYDVAL